MKSIASSLSKEEARRFAAQLGQEIQVLAKRYDEVVDPLTGRTPRGWLLPFRPLLRSVLTRDQRVTRHELKELLRFCDRPLRPIVIWLIGRSASRFNLRGLDCYIGSPEPEIRKQVARALRRLEAIQSLAQMAHLWPEDAWVQRFAAERVRAPYRNRLKRFVTNHVDDSAAELAKGPSRMSYWARERFWYLTPPKSLEEIRRILLRIHRWARRKQAG